MPAFQPPRDGVDTGITWMNLLTAYRLGVLLFACQGVSAFAADSELEQLRQQNAALKSQIEALRRACPASVSPSASGAVAPASAGPGKSAAAPPQAPEGYKLVKIDPAAAAADEENCGRGLFSRTKDAPWKHEDVWQELSRRMQPEQVESLLGKNHTLLSSGDRTQWEYGKCTTASHALAYVVFDRDGLLFWQPPDF